MAVQISIGKQLNDGSWPVNIEPDVKGTAVAVEPQSVRSWDALEAIVAEHDVAPFGISGDGLPEMREVLGPPSQVEDCLIFVRAWAEAVLRQVSRVRELRKTSEVRSRNFERDEDWSPTTDDLERDFRTLWTEEHALVWAAYQLERWTHRLQQERGQAEGSSETVLKNLRDALEHLDDARFSKGFALPGAAKKDSHDYNRSLRALPGSRLSIAVGGYALFGLIDPEELENWALATVNVVEEDLADAAAEQYFDLSDG